LQEVILTALGPYNYRLTSKTLISGWSVLTELSKTSHVRLSARVSHSEGDI
jgi:hypothetical protein